jgi:predicted nucleotidyltransferase
MGTPIDLDIDIENELSHLVNDKVVYASVVGSHQYGWNDDSSDVDIHGCFISPLMTVLSLEHSDMVISRKFYGKIEVNLFELEKELKLILDNNCNAYEHISSPHRLITSQIYTELLVLSKHALSKKIINSYMGLATHNYKKYIEPFIHKEPASIPAKKFLYVMRALMSGIYVLNKGHIESNIYKLNRYHNFDVIDKLIEVKKSKYGTNGLNYKKLDETIQDLFIELKTAEKESPVIPDTIDKSVYEQVNRFMYRTRLLGANHYEFTR